MVCQVCATHLGECDSQLCPLASRPMCMPVCDVCCVQEVLGQCKLEPTTPHSQGRLPFTIDFPGFRQIQFPFSLGRSGGGRRLASSGGEGAELPYSQYNPV